MARLQREVARSKSEGTMVKYSGAAQPVICAQAPKATVPHLVTRGQPLTWHKTKVIVATLSQKTGHMLKTQR